MNDLDTFTINFIVNGLDKLQDGIKDLRTQMDDLDTSFTQSTTKGDTFFGKFSGWVESLAGLAAGFIGVRDAINGTFAVSDKIIDLNLTADKVGRTALEVETLSRALRGFTKNTNADLIGEAGNLYDRLNTITGKAWRLQFGKVLTDELNRAKITFTGEESDQEMVSKIIQGLEYHTQRKDWDSRKQLANVLGLSETAVAFLGSGQANVDRILKAESEKAFLYKEDNLKNAEALRKARLELKDTWDKIYSELQPVVTSMIEKFTILVGQLEPVIQTLANVLNWVIEKYNWLLEKTTGYAEKGGKLISEGVDYTKAYHSFKELGEMFGVPNWEEANANVSFKDLQSKLFYAKKYADYSNDEYVKKSLEIFEDRIKVINSNRFGSGGISNNKTANVNIQNQNFYGDTKTLAKKVEKAVGNGVNVALVGTDSLHG